MDQTDDSLSIYLQEIGKIPILDRQEEITLVKKAKINNREAYERLISAHLRFVVSLAKLYKNKGVPLIDLVAEGNIGLLYAFNRFDETRGVRFASYAVWWIKQRVLRALGTQVKVIKFPTRKLKNVRQISKIEAKLSQILGRMPSITEIANAMGVEEKYILKAINIVQQELSLDTNIGGEEFTLFDVIQAAPESLEKSIVRELYASELKEALTHIPEREANILTRYYGLSGQEPATLEQIGQEIHLTRERVRQIKLETIKRLNTKN